MNVLKDLSYSLAILRSIIKGRSVEKVTVGLPGITQVAIEYIVHRESYTYYWYANTVQIQHVY